jgi:hypothetical protein
MYINAKNDFLNCSSEDDLHIEVECRAGSIKPNQATGYHKFESGLKGHELFHQMRDYLVSKTMRIKKDVNKGWYQYDNKKEPVTFKFTDLIDLAFEDGYSVSIRKDNFSVKEVMKKISNEEKVDFHVDNIPKKQVFDLRLSSSSEISIKENDVVNQLKAKVSSVVNVKKLPNRDLIYGGNPLTIGDEVIVKLVSHHPKTDDFARFAYNSGGELPYSAHSISLN